MDNDMDNYDTVFRRWCILTLVELAQRAWLCAIAAVNESQRETLEAQWTTCPGCGGNMRVPSPDAVAADMMIPCPRCEGRGQITIGSLESDDEVHRIVAIAQARCPYCGAIMTGPEMEYDQDGYSMAIWTCHCGAQEVTRYPPQ